MTKKSDETETKTSDAKQEAPTRSPTGIPVARIRFLKSTQMPGIATTTELASTTSKNRRRWDIELLPHIRSFKITYTPPDGGEVQVRMVHETRIDTWDPA